MKGSRGILLWLVTFSAGLYFFLEFLLPEAFLKSVGWSEHHEAISNGFVVVGVMAFGLGLFNLIRHHAALLAFQRPGWINSAALLAGLFSAFIATSAVWIRNLQISTTSAHIGTLILFSDKINEQAQLPGADDGALRIKLKLLLDAAHIQISKIPIDTSAHELDMPSISDVSLNTIAEKSKAAGSFLRQFNALALTRLRAENENAFFTRLYNILFDGLFVPLGSAMFALLGVYIGTAAYRAFRIHSIEAALMMIAAVVVMLGQISFGRLLYEHLPAIRQWLLETPNAAAFRAIRLGTAVAGLIMALRMWLSIRPKGHDV